MANSKTSHPTHYTLSLIVDPTVLSSGADAQGAVNPNVIFEFVFIKNGTWYNKIHAVLV